MAGEDGTEDALFSSGPLKGTYRRLVALPTGVEWALDESTSCESVGCGYRLRMTLLRID